MRLTFCLAEDRVEEEAGVRLVILSLCKHHPEAVIYLYRPKPTSAFSNWLQAYPQVTLIPDWPGTSGWNCKPRALLDILDRGCEDVIWLDTDVLVTRPFEHLFVRLDDKTLVVAEEPAVSPQQGTSVRTKGWKLAMGREFPVTINSCLLRVTRVHRPLLVRWDALLANPDYAAAQSKPLYERPIHLFSDQDALNALLGSAEFSEVAVQYLRRGRDVAHTGGARTYSLGERLRGLFHRVPPFLHNQWWKPWIVLNPEVHALPGRFWMFHRVILEASPYVAVARTYRGDLESDTSWMRYSSPLGRVVRMLGFGHFALRGMPLTIVATMTAIFKDLRHRLRKALKS